jgi:hypothetical protein
MKNIIFALLLSFSAAAQTDSVYGVYLNELSEIEAHDIFGDTLVDIIL